MHIGFAGYRCYRNENAFKLCPTLHSHKHDLHAIDPSINTMISFYYFDHLTDIASQAGAIIFGAFHKNHTSSHFDPFPAP